MVSRSVVVGALLAAFAATGPLGAQDESLTLMVRGGGFNSAIELDDGTTAGFGGGYAFGAGVGVPLTPNLRLRGDLSLARSELRRLGHATGAKLDRLFVDGTAEYRYPTASGLDVYGFAGAGMVRLRETDVDGDATIEPAGVLGAGVAYPIGDSRLGFFLEAKGWVYRLGGLGGPFADLERTELEIGWGGGLSYGLPF